MFKWLITGLLVFGCIVLPCGIYEGYRYVGAYNKLEWAWAFGSGLQQMTIGTVLMMLGIRGYQYITARWVVKRKK